MKVIDKENNIVEDICPSCGKDGAIIQTTEYADGSKYIEVMCLNGCGHFARIIKRESELINEQIDNEEWIKNMDTEQLAETIHKIIDDGLCGLCKWDCRERCIVQKADENKVILEWLKQPHTKVPKK